MRVGDNSCRIAAVWQHNLRFQMTDPHHATLFTQSVN